MTETLTFHFEGALADRHRMNFYESARFQYAAARLMVKLAQFRAHGRFVQKITNVSNFDIQLTSQSDGSFNINVEDPGQEEEGDDFIKISLSDLIAYVSERVIEKIEEEVMEHPPVAAKSEAEEGTSGSPVSALDQFIDENANSDETIQNLPVELRGLVKRRVSEVYREQRLQVSQSAVSRIDFARGQKLIAMSAPLISEMATALRKSANTLEVTSSKDGQAKSVLFLDQEMAQSIETAVVDKEITPILGDVVQFNKDNGWGKVKIDQGKRTVSFSIPYDILPHIRQKIIDTMKRDMVYLQTYFVRDRSDELVRMLVVGVLPTPTE